MTIIATSKHQLGRPVKMLQTSWPLMWFVIMQTKSNRKFQSQDQSYQCQGQVAKTNDIHQLGLCIQNQGNVS